MLWMPPSLTAVKAACNLIIAEWFITVLGQFSFHFNKAVKVF